MQWRTVAAQNSAKRAAGITRISLLTRQNSALHWLHRASEDDGTAPGVRDRDEGPNEFVHHWTHVKDRAYSIASNWSEQRKRVWIMK
jgi:hypothetical protein